MYQEKGILLLTLEKITRGGDRDAPWLGKTRRGRQYRTITGRADGPGFRGVKVEDCNVVHSGRVPRICSIVSKCSHNFELAVHDHTSPYFIYLTPRAQPGAFDANTFSHQHISVAKVTASPIRVYSGFAASQRSRRRRFKREYGVAPAPTYLCTSALDDSDDDAMLHHPAPDSSLHITGMTVLLAVVPAISATPDLLIMYSLADVNMGIR